MTGADRTIFLELMTENIRLILEHAHRVDGPLDWLQKVLQVYVGELNVDDISFEDKEKYIPDFSYHLFGEKKATLFVGTD